MDDDTTAQDANAPDETAAAPTPEAASDVRQPADDVGFLLQQAEAALQSVVDSPHKPVVRPFELPQLGGSTPSGEQASLELLRDVELGLRIELGRTTMPLEDVLRLKTGSVVTLDKLAGDPVDLYVNGRLVARGEVLVLNDNFCVRVTELVSGHDYAAENS